MTDKEVLIKIQGIDIIKSDILNSITENYFQFQKQYPKKHSLLFDDIKSVLDCKQAEAEKLAGTHCNMVSFWSSNVSKGNTSMKYAEFYDNMLENKFCNKEGFIKVASDPEHSKEIVCNDIFGFQYTMEYFEDYEDVLKPLIRLDPKCFYQLKMKGDTSGFHFIACYIDSQTGFLMGSDTSYRGTPFVLSKKITKDNFVWLLKI